MSKFLLASLLAIGTLLGASQASAQASTRDQIRIIESEYARINNGRIITDDQLEYYLDRSARAGRCPASARTWSPPAAPTRTPPGARRPAGPPRK